MEIERRKLRFDRLEDAVADAERLLSVGYYKTGNWDLTQCCHHLSVLMLYPIEGFPNFPLPMRIGSWVLRYTLAPWMLKQTLASDHWPEGVPTDHNSVPVETGQDAQGVEELRSAVDRLSNHAGPLMPSPLFGMLDKPTLIKLHCIHAAHHLGFLVPKTESASAE